MRAIAWAKVKTDKVGSVLAKLHASGFLPEVWLAKGGRGAAAAHRGAQSTVSQMTRLKNQQLKPQNHRAAVKHRRIYRPWGYYQDIDLAARYRVKRIVVKPGSKLSLQKALGGGAWNRGSSVNNQLCSVHENESICIPIGGTHRLANPGKITLELIEVQFGSYLGEDDIVRFDDTYGRQ